jgi:hypothetical protein
MISRRHGGQEYECERAATTTTSAAEVTNHSCRKRALPARWGVSRNIDSGPTLRGLSTYESLNVLLNETDRPRAIKSTFAL